MNVPPLVARVRVHTPRRAYRLWVPLFLIWALLLLLLVPVLLVALAVTVLIAPRWTFVPAARGAWDVLCASRGTRVAVDGGRSRIFVALH
jgi:hypothetical protein